MYRVLLVDDEALVRDAISAKIRWEELGYELAGACKNGKEALEFIRQNPVDLLLTDICMPFMDGMELSRQVYTDFPQIHIVIFSGYNEFEYAKNAMKYRVEEYLLKPVTARELTDTLCSLKRKLDEERKEDESNRELQQEYRKNRSLVRAKALTNLVLGNKTMEEHRAELSEAGIELEAAAYEAASLEIDLYSELFSPDKEQKEQSALMSFMVFNIADELVNARRAGIAFQRNDNSTVIIFMSSFQKEFHSAVAKTCLDIQKAIAVHVKMPVTIGIGSCVHSPEEISRSYEEAKAAVGYRYLLGEGRVIDTAVIREKQTDILTLEEPIDRVIMGIQSDDKRKIRDGLEEIGQMLAQTYQEKNKVYLYLQQVVVAVNGLMKTADLNSTSPFQSAELFIHNISEAKTLSQMLEYLGGYCINTAEELKLQREGSGSRQALLALDYIEKNYGKAELNLQMVCDYLAISPSYFSTIFKNYTGETFVESLTRKRMEKAMELLAHTNMKNYEIAERVGFADPHYFSIAFKKATGKTPKEYARETRRL